MGKKDHEFLPTPAAHRIAFPGPGFQGVGQELQHFVADVMAVAVVDALEIIRIHQEQAKGLMVTAAVGQGLIHQLEKLAPIAQAGQSVPQGGPFQLLFQALLFRNVMDDAEHQAPPVQFQRPGIGLDMAGAAVRQAGLEIEGFVASGQLGHLVHDGHHLPPQHVDFPGMQGAKLIVGVAVETGGRLIGIRNAAILLGVDKEHGRCIGAEQALVKTPLVPAIFPGAQAPQEGHGAGHPGDFRVEPLKND